MKRIKLVVTDLDNTLWDWFDVWHKSFSAMLKKLSTMSGLPQELLIKEMREVHRTRRTTEYSYLLNEIPSLCRMHPGEKPLEVYDAAIHVMNSERRRAIKLYDGVGEALSELSKLGVPVVGYTESVSYWSEWRIKKTGLDGLLNVLYSSPDHDFPAGVSVANIRMLPSANYGLKYTKHRSVPGGLIKPNASILKRIISDFGVQPEEVAYVGDSLMKDIAMAQAVGVQDIFASYGVVQNRSEYDLLRSVSHWSQEDIDREKKLAENSTIEPTYIFHDSFSEILEMFDFAGDSRG